ncbi:MAG: hypothetical protein BWY47_01622 [Bacteroidetes bacterium ADurb.Bin302]|nr:MAG: hypothetical protein BWY47_01622 [Bacteroidetes bacterium ADurb.Bin302]
MAIIKFDKEKLFDFIREIQQKSPRNQSHYYIESDFKYKDENGKMSRWFLRGWCVPTDALTADDVILKEVKVKSENKYQYCLMFTSREDVIRYILDDRYLEAIGIERRRI